MYGSQWGSLAGASKAVFCTTIHVRIRINEIQGSYDKIIITRKNITRLLPLALLLVLRTHNNTDGNILYYGDICDPLSENPVLRANIEFELEAILSVQVVSQLNSDYYTNVSQGAWTVTYQIMKPESATIKTI